MEVLLSKILNLPKKVRYYILILIDLLSILISYFIANYIFGLNIFRTGVNIIIDSLILVIVCLSIYIITGQYKELTKHNTSKSINYIIYRHLIILSIIGLCNISNIRTITGILTIVTISIIFNKILLSKILRSFSKRNRKTVVIYGAGSAGVEFAQSIKYRNDIKLLYFIDDDISLIGRKLDGIRIYNRTKLKELENEIDIVYFCIAKISEKNKQNILNILSEFKFETQVIPSLEDITNNKAKTNQTRPINIEELIYRTQAEIQNKDTINAIKDKVICITGGGGSIGSELARILTRLKPKKIIILDISEFNLYKIKNEFENKINSSSKIKYVLGNTTDEKIINEIIQTYKVNIILHSAAYKHVPIVEENPISGMSNNVLSAITICNSASLNNIEKVILISTDKAVRPSNIMGASKRISELVFLNAHKLSKNKANKINTKFSIVRFGNVMGSSGSVIPLFENQIKNGGPITITHPNIIRYFMTINEACTLVLQATALCEGGEIYLLDMGKPIKIYDLARKMVKLSGKTIRDYSNPKGDIEIRYLGLREGEKLYEELLINGKTSQTKHNLIYISEESDNESLKKYISNINELKINLKNRELNKSILLMKNIIPEWVISKNYQYINSLVENNY